MRQFKSGNISTETTSGQSSSDSNVENVVFKLELDPDLLTDSQSHQKQQQSQLTQQLELSVGNMPGALCADHKPLVMSPIDNNKKEPRLSAEQKEESHQPETPRPGGNVPLAVPMMANTMHSSVTRNDAKKITETRLKRLRALSQTAEEVLSKGQKDEKKRIIRLEKNRRAAAMSRRKKKIYVKNLEENSKLMARHIAILEMENNHLRAMISVAQPGTPMRPFPPSMHPMYKVPQQMPAFMAPPQAAPSTASSMPSSTTSLEPPMKRRKIEMSTASTSDVCSDIDAPNEGTANSLEPEPMEPLPLPIPVTAPPAPPSIPRMDAIPRMLQMMPPPGHMIPPNMRLHPSRMMPFPMSHPMASMLLHQNGMAPPSTPTTAPPRVFAPEIGKLEATVTDMNADRNNKENMAPHAHDESERKSVETDDEYGRYLDNLPPNDGPGVVPDSDFCHLSILDDNDDIAVIDETVDECGSIVGFQADSKNAQMVYL